LFACIRNSWDGSVLFCSNMTSPSNCARFDSITDTYVVTPWAVVSPLVVITNLAVPLSPGTVLTFSVLINCMLVSVALLSSVTPTGVELVVLVSAVAVYCVSPCPSKLAARISNPPSPANGSAYATPVCIVSNATSIQRLSNVPAPFASRVLSCMCVPPLDFELVVFVVALPA
jgi:hypothetical protein